MDSSLGININPTSTADQSNHINLTDKTNANNNNISSISNKNNNSELTINNGVNVAHDTNCSTKDLDLFFANGLYNSCQATDELIKTIEQSQDEALARKALMFYQRHYSTLERPWDHVTFMYGLGLIYMHFNAYNWAIKSFREAIYVQPNFDRSRDVHTRLGLIFKSTGLFRLSEKHFNLAINDTRPHSGTCTKLQLKFHLAHLYEIQGKVKQAMEAYESLLKENDLPSQLSANIHRQLGWLYFNHPESTQDWALRNGRRENMHDTNNHQQQHHNPETKNHLDVALNYLNASYRTDSDPRTSYYLGRCFTDIGKFQDAFASYRSVIDREESTADTWCSIGVLYHRQNQPMDALQAYIRCVQFDKGHAVAWMNLGILYESYNQFNDALKCYQHVLRSKTTEFDRTLHARIRYIQKHMADIESSLGYNRAQINSEKLLSLEDLWNLESKTSHEVNTSNKINISTIANNTDPSNALKPPTITQGNPQTTSDQNPTPLSNLKGKPASSIGSFSISDQTTDVSPQPAEDVKDLLSNRSTTNDDTLRLDSTTNLLTNSNIIHPSIPTSNHIGLLEDCKLDFPTNHGSSSSSYGGGSQDLKPQSMNFKDFNQILTNGASKDSGISSNSSTYTDCALVPSQNADIFTTDYVSAEQVIESYRNSLKPKKIDINMLSDDDRPPDTFPVAPPYPPQPIDKLFPSPPNMYIESKKDIVSEKILDFCQSSPISIVRNMATVLKLDLGLFSTKSLVEHNPEQQVEVLSHSNRQACESSGRDEQIRNVWFTECQRSESTIARYASYQVSSFKEFLNEDVHGSSSDIKTKPNLTKESETDSNESASANAKRSLNNGSANHEPPMTSSSTSRATSTKKFKKEPPTVKIVRSAIDIDLSDEKKWRPQLTELNKLPYFIKCVSASNMLTHLGTIMPNLNSVAMSMHVPGCKIVRHSTPSNFCPVNINVGPGDYEWCAISAEYGRVFSRICNKHGFELDNENWWPRLSDLQKHNIPVYRFSQRPGDLVWVNSGTIYWVQATGWCNNIHWNVGPLCAKQYRLASESTEINKFSLAKPGVPMVQITWNIIINITVILDDDLWHSMLDVLRRSLRYCVLIKDLVEEMNIHIESVEGLSGPRVAKHCSLCECEVFNYCFLRKSDGSLHCFECARRADSSLEEFTIKQEYELSYLAKLYDNYIETRRKHSKNSNQAHNHHIIHQVKQEP